jgi:hypothetical protein
MLMDAANAFEGRINVCNGGGITEAIEGLLRLQKKSTLPLLSS